MIGYRRYLPDRQNGSSPWLNRKNEVKNKKLNFKNSHPGYKNQKMGIFGFIFRYFLIYA
jgi:hypothetical protein